MMKQVTKFYITSFLKNQTYFTPIMIIFLQLNKLSYQEIFWVFTIGSIVSFILEIPTGIIGDMWGKKKSVILSKLGIFLSYLFFGFSSTFWMFVIAQLFFEIGNSFRTGTETAFIYDYLNQNENTPSYRKVKIAQKFWARVSESIATAIGGFLAAWLGHNWVFFIAAVPAFFNFILAISWDNVKEKKKTKFSMKKYRIHASDSVKESLKHPDLLSLILNIAIFNGVLVALNKFVQPYMLDAGVPVELFGIIYTISLALTAISIKYSEKVEEIVGGKNIISILTIIAFIPTLIIGLKFISIIGVGLFFIVVIVGNFISPIANDKFHELVKSDNRSTMGSILELFKSGGKILLMPLAGFFADVYSMYTSILIMGLILLFSGIIVHLGSKKHLNQNRFKS